VRYSGVCCHCGDSCVCGIVECAVVVRTRVCVV